MQCNNKKCDIYNGRCLISSPAPMANVSFSNHLLTVVGPSLCLSVCLFTCFTSSIEPLDQTFPILVQNILMGWEFDTLKIKDRPSLKKRL